VRNGAGNPVAPRTRPLPVFESAQKILFRLFSTVNAIRNPDAAISVSRKLKSRKLFQVRFYALDFFEMADVVLGHRARVTVNAAEERFGGYAQQRRQFITHAGYDRAVVLFEHERLQCPADERSQQNRPFGRSARVFNAAEGAGQDLA
jgi:hypothetical protein